MNTNMPETAKVEHAIENVADKIESATDEQKENPVWLSNLESSLKSLTDQVKALTDLPRTQSAELLSELQSLRAELKELKEMAVIEPDLPTPEAAPAPNPPPSSKSESGGLPEAKPEAEKPRAKTPKAPPDPASARRAKRWI